MAKTKKEMNLKFIKGENGKPGYYITDITLNYKRIRRYAGSNKEAARNYIAKLRIAAKEGVLEELINPKSDRDTFGAYARILLDSAEWQIKRNSSRNEISLKHLNCIFKDMIFEEINPGVVRKYITERKEDGMAPATINRELSLLKSILYAAEYDGLIASNPIRGRRVKKLEENNSREKTILNLKLQDNDLRQLVECAAPHLKPILKIALITGMRRGEILKMQWKDINFRLGTIRIPKENSKSKKERVIPIDSILFNVLDSIEKKGDYVFMNNWSGKRRKNVNDAFRTACKRAGIESGRKKGLTFHDLRHLAAYRLVKSMDIMAAAKILGHADVKMTMRYCHPSDKDMRLGIEKVAQNLFPGRQKDVNAKISTALKGSKNRLKSIRIK